MANHTIEARDFDANRSSTTANTTRSRPSLLDEDVSLMNEVADGIIERDRKRMQREVVRYISFACAILSCICGGSITSFSLYAPYFQKDLYYNQYRINAVSITAELALYIPVPFLGYICDRFSPRPLSLVSSIFFGAGYLLAAFTYRSGPPKDTGYGDGWPFGIMVLSFVGVGIGTCSMYLSAVSTCAKNFAKSKHAGLVLAAPIAAFGLSGMWQSQIGVHLLWREAEDHGVVTKGLDVFRYFLFLGCLLLAVGLIGAVGLRVVGEEDLIDERVEELERSGLLEDSEFFRSNNNRRSYGTLNDGAADEGDNDNDDGSDTAVDLSESMLLAKQKEMKAREEERRKKNWLLNLETRRFLSDPTMWFLAAGFLLVTGPGEAYINNFGTIITSLTPESWAARDPPAGTASTHVSTIAITSTIARLLTGTLSDLLAPRADSNNIPKITTTASSDTDLAHAADPESRPRTAQSLTDAPMKQTRGISRLYLLLTSSALLLLCFLTVALIVPNHPSTFPLSSALLGLGYGASFSLCPIIITVVWGVENFATNWGVVALTPAVGAALWSAVYAAGYNNAAAMVDGSGDGTGAGKREDQCFGPTCFVGWAWGCAASVAVAMVLFGGAWRGWRRRDVVV